jgi:2-polyprenyl-3-methyl-5-hydroxy-6-metoxy-1,4-benzoquinol methylase
MVEPIPMPEKLLSCPACGNNSLKPFMKVQDYSVSGEVFDLELCSDCDLVFTNPRPKLEESPRYYQSEAYISHTNSKEGLMNKAYQWARQRAIKGKIGHLSQYIEQKGSLLDYGCGTGEFLNAAQLAGWHVRGLEIDAGARQQALQNHGLTVEDPIQLSNIPSDSIQVITLWHVLEHVHSLKETVAHFQRCLQPGGYLVIAVPNRTAYDASKFGPFWAAWDVPRHLYHFSEEPVRNLMSKNGFKHLNIKGMFFDPFYITLLSTRYKTGRSNLFQAALTGIITNMKGWSNRSFHSSLLYTFQKE